MDWLQSPCSTGGGKGRDNLMDYEICYLCGSALVEPIDWDHVPPRQLYAPAIRRTHQPQLLTIPVHAACNKGFQKDEDYFVHALMPYARGSYAGNAFYQKTLDTFREGRNPGLVRKVL